METLWRAGEAAAEPERHGCAAPSDVAGRPYAGAPSVFHAWFAHLSGLQGRL